MRDPHDLFNLNSTVVPSGLALIAALSGFADAGAALVQTTKHLLETLEHELVAEFDADELYDYRARRPTFTFVEDHIVEYELPQLSLHLVRDEIHEPFLLLSGFEPDFKWQRFASAIAYLVDLFQVSSTTVLGSIPMPVPHTRQIGLTVSGNRPEFVEQMSVWRPTTQVGSGALHFIEFHLNESGHSVAGFVLLVPHYLADSVYPAAAIAALDVATAATGRIFPTDTLREANREFISKITEQVSASDELSTLVATLEERYDEYMQDSTVRAPFADEDGELPTADEIAAEFESFLAGRQTGNEGSKGQ